MTSNTDERVALTYSMLASFRNCRRACKLHYIDLLRVADRPEAQVTGSLIHECLECWYLTADFSQVEKHIAQMCSAAGDHVDDASKNRHFHTVAMMEGYVAAYPRESFEILALELPFAGEIINPATGAKSRTYTMAGRVDAVVRDDSGIWLNEYKTASRIDAGYIEKLWSDMQIRLYSVYLEQVFGWHITGVNYIMLTKVRAAQEMGETDAEWAERLAAAKAPGRCKRKMPETDAEYLERLREKYAPASMYPREQIYFTPRDLEELQFEVWELTQQLLACKRDPQGRAWYKNTSQCYVYNHACDYCRLCQATANEDAVRSAFYTVADDMHGEVNAQSAFANAESDMF